MAPPFRPKWYFIVPVFVVTAGVLVPIVYLFIRAFQAEASLLADLLLRTRNLHLLVNTFLLAAGVLAVGTAIAFPMAWLTTRTDLKGARFLTLLGVLPLAIPGYVMAYVLLATTGSYGTLAHLFDIDIPRLSGYSGSLLALSLSTFPYLFLNLRTSLHDLDPSLEETARSLGYSTGAVLYRVVLPQLRPAFYSGAMLVGLHVLGDFGVVSLMRFETFSYALYLQYSASYDRIYAAWLALMLLGLTGTILLLEARLLWGLLLHRAGTGVSRKVQFVRLGSWRIVAYPLIGIVTLASVFVPVLTVFYWTTTGFIWSDIGAALLGSVSASAPAAILAGTLAVPLAYMSVRAPSAFTRAAERLAYFGYATPPLAFALALIFFSLQAVPWAYQTMGLLIFAYAIHFLAEAIGPVRSALYLAPPTLEEAARTLGSSPLHAFFTATFPLLERGLLVSVAFVFLSAMKELPITFLLSPIGFETLALNVWGLTSEALFGAAAPFALAIMLFSSLFVGLLLLQEKTPAGR